MPVGDPAPPEADLPANPYDRAVLRGYLRADGSLKEIPLQEKKFQAVLRHLQIQFAPGQRYSEKQVNAVLGRFHADVATLRRGLVDFKLLERTVTGKEYWRV
jgi:hypothetical protein